MPSPRYSWVKNRRSLFVNWDPTAHSTLQHNQLLPQHGVLCFKLALGLEERGRQVQEEDYQRGMEQYYPHDFGNGRAGKGFYEQFLSAVRARSTCLGQIFFSGRPAR
jgi:hypothetical protein